jgi:hypothetical protein
MTAMHTSATETDRRRRNASAFERFMMYEHVSVANTGTPTKQMAANAAFSIAEIWWRRR